MTRAELMIHRTRPGPDEYAEFEAAYIARVPAGELLAILEGQLGPTSAMLREIPEAHAHWAYAPGKWSIKEVVGHLSDTERIMAYRALRIARGDETPLPGFDENAYVPHGRFGERSLRGLIEEFEAVRRSTVALFAGLPREAWVRRGIVNGFEHTARALGWVVAGHELHHRDILERRYLNRTDTRL